MTKKIEYMQFALLILLILIFEILYNKVDYIMKRTFTMGIYFIFIDAIFIILGLIMSIPKIIRLKSNKFKANYKYIIFESVLICMLIILYIYRPLLILIEIKIISLCVGFFLINCIKDNSQNEGIS